MPVKFTYERLNYSRNEVRYLQILPQPGAVIQCRLDHKPLEPGHICLSHRWSDKSATREIFINDRPYAVSANIWHFLDIARHKFKQEDRFWIDAICIDQQNVLEKNRQVPLMGNIYRSAKLVVSWLGVCDDTTRRCLEVIQSGNFDLGTNHFDQAITGTDIFRRDFWDHLVRFFQNDYWKRAWVVQEVLLAADRYLQIGDVELSWQRLVDSWGIATRNAPQTHLPRLCEWNFRHEERPMQAIKEGKTATLRSLIARYGKQSCIDFHDRIYSLLSLAQDRDRLAVDYRCTREQLFFDTLRACGTDKCFCLAACLMNILRVGGKSEKEHPEYTPGAWHRLRLPTDADLSPIVSFGINREDSLPLGRDIHAPYTNKGSEDDWRRNLPYHWKQHPGKNIRFLYTAVPADFLIRKSPVTNEWYCAAIRFHRVTAWTKGTETFPYHRPSGISVHTHPGSYEPCCIQLTRSALLKILTYGEQHTICQASSLGGYQLVNTDNVLSCGKPIERFHPHALPRTSVPYRRLSESSTPRPTTPLAGALRSPGQVASHASELRKGLGHMSQDSTPGKKFSWANRAMSTRNGVTLGSGLGITL